MGHYGEVEKIRANPEVYNYSKDSATRTWILRENFLFDILKKLDRSSKILDIGVWSGYFLNRLYEMGFRDLHGIDMVDCRNNLGINEASGDSNLERYKFEIADMNYDKLNFENNSLDAVTSFQTIEHLENYFHILHEVTRVLKPGGLFMMSVPNPHNIIQRIKFMLTGNLSSWNIGNDHLLFLTHEVFQKTYLRDFELLDTYFDKGMIPFWGRLNIIPFVRVGCRKALLPRGRLFGFRVCYVMKKK